MSRGSTEKVFFLIGILILVIILVLLFYKVGKNIIIEYIINITYGD